MCCRIQHLVTHPFTCWPFSSSCTWPWKGQKSGLESAGGIRTAVWEIREDTHGPEATQGSQTWSWLNSEQQKSLSVGIRLEFWSLHQSGHLNYWKGPAFWLHRAQHIWEQLRLGPAVGYHRCIALTYNGYSTFAEIDWNDSDSISNRGLAVLWRGTYTALGSR